MLENTVDILEQIELFIGLKLYKWPRHKLTPRFTGNYSETIFNHAEKYLLDYYKLKNDSLFSIIDLEFPWNLKR